MAKGWGWREKDREGLIRVDEGTRRVEEYKGKGGGVYRGQKKDRGGRRRIEKDTGGRRIKEAGEG